jgi:hypothetical protein
MSGTRSRLTFANVVAVLALFVALGSSATAAVLITGKNVKDGTLTGKDIKNSSVGSVDIKDGNLHAKDFKAGELPAGPQGMQGAQGVPGTNGTDGTNGADGATKVVVRDFVKTTPTASNDAASAQCSTGEVATGGGWELLSGSIGNFVSFGDWPVKAGGKAAAPGDTHRLARLDLQRQRTNRQLARVRDLRVAVGSRRRRARAGPTRRPPANRLPRGRR